MPVKVLAWAMVALFGLAAAACSTGDAGVTGPSPAETAPLPVEVVQPRRADIHATYETTATVTADSEALVVARVPGEVIELGVEEGARVEAGQPLARLDGERLRLQMLAASARYEQSAGEYQRLLRLHERGLISSAAFETLRFERDALQAAYELQRLNYGYTTIRAPISGVVASRYIQPGAHVAAGTPLFRITDTGKLLAYLHVPQTELARIQAAETALVRVDAIPEAQFNAHIVRISPTVDARTGTFRATARIENPGGLLAPGMFTRFSIVCETREDALVLPREAIVREDNESVVYLVRNGSAVRRSVTTGIESGGMTEILQGVSADDRVVITGQAVLRDGSRVLAHDWVADSTAG
jgi:membrane fusion protein, multidrug efflux system